VAKAWQFCNDLRKVEILRTRQQINVPQIKKLRNPNKSFMASVGMVYFK
jgi:hypothetical protein